MRHCIVFMLVLFMCLQASPAVAQDSAREKTALAATLTWLALVDSGEYGLSWMDAADYFRSAITNEQWVQSLQAVRKPLGKVISRDVDSMTYRTSLPGAPDGEYVVIQFKTVFQNKRSAVETVTPMVDRNGGWRVSGYFIK